MSEVRARMPTMTDATPADQAPTRPDIVLGDVVLDTDDPPRLAEFYAALARLGDHPAGGGLVEHRAAGRPAPAACPSSSRLDHRPPSWPDNQVPQQFHLDLDVPAAELSSSVAYAQSIGATMADNSRSESTFVVLLDPSGHPFCLCACCPSDRSDIGCTS